MAHCADRASAERGQVAAGGPHVASTGLPGDPHDQQRDADQAQRDPARDGVGDRFRGGAGPAPRWPAAPSTNGAARRCWTPHASDTSGGDADERAAQRHRVVQREQQARQQCQGQPAAERDESCSTPVSLRRRQIPAATSSAAAGKRVAARGDGTSSTTRITVARPSTSAPSQEHQHGPRLVTATTAIAGADDGQHHRGHGLDVRRARVTAATAEHAGGELSSDTRGRTPGQRGCASTPASAAYTARATACDGLLSELEHACPGAERVAADQDAHAAASTSGEASPPLRSRSGEDDRRGPTARVVATTPSSRSRGEAASQSVSTAEVRRGGEAADHARDGVAAPPTQAPAAAAAPGGRPDTPSPQRRVELQDDQRRAAPQRQHGGREARDEAEGRRGRAADRRRRRAAGAIAATSTRAERHPDGDHGAASSVEVR